MKNFNWKLLSDNQSQREVKLLLNGLNVSFGYNNRNYKGYNNAWHVGECEFYISFAPDVEDINIIYRRIFESFM